MNRLTFFFVLVLFSCVLFAQEEIIPVKQFMLGCANVGSSEQVTHYIDASGEVWQYSSGSFVTGGVYNNSLVTIGNANFQISDWPGFNFNWLFGAPYWSLGLYKVTNSKQTDKYFYLDDRDCDFGGNIYSPDFWIYFDNDEDAYFHRVGGEISQGEVVRIWNVHEESPNTTGLQNYWNNVLALVNQENHPRIIWGPYQASGITVQKYRIYRKYGGSPWVLFYSTSDASVLEFTDENLSITQPGGQSGVNVQYKVCAVYNNTVETSFSNIVSVNVIGQEIEKAVQQENALNTNTYGLQQNYPNPFNPATVISFSIAENSLVTLKVCDVLGNEISELVNEVKKSGDYSVPFDASKFSSGIYFYTLKANGYSLTKKMLLAK